MFFSICLNVFMFLGMLQYLLRYHKIRGTSEGRDHVPSGGLVPFFRPGHGVIAVVPNLACPISKVWLSRPTTFVSCSFLVGPAFLAPAPFRKLHFPPPLTLGSRTDISVLFFFFFRRAVSVDSLAL
jgi:hypothetical protein